MERKKTTSPNPSSIFFFVFFFVFFVFFAAMADCKSTIEPCSNADSCNALVGYSLYADLKVSEVASLFQIDPLSLLAINGYDLSAPGSTDRILPAGLLLRVPVVCSCEAGIRRSVSVRYVLRPSDSLISVAGSVYGGLVSADQIREANGIGDGEIVDSGRSVLVPLPCVCFNYTDNQLPAVFLSYVVRPGDTVATIAAAYSTTVSDVMNVNAMSNPSISAGDILAIALPACASSFSRYAADYGLIAAKGSIVLAANRCVQCSCGLSDLDLYCLPTTLPVSCTSMGCANSGLMLGGIATQTSSAGCSVMSCSYTGFINSTITTQLTTSLQPKCPVLSQLTAPSPPPAAPVRRPATSPAPAPGPVMNGFRWGSTGLGPVAETPSGKVTGGTAAGNAAQAVGVALLVAAIRLLL
ncbi:lysm domain GPI-anchored protein 1 precursor [Wolffia australiana]